MDMQTQDDLPLSPFADPSLSRRRFLRGAAVAGTGLIAAGLAACAPATAPSWTFGPGVAAPPLTESGSPSATMPAASMDHSMAPSVAPSAGASPDLGTIPPGWSAHDVEARNTVRRYLGDLVKALPDVYPPAVVAKLAAILGVEDGYPELDMKPAFAQVPQVVIQNATKPLEPEIVAGVKVFRLTIDAFQQRIDELQPPIEAVGYNAQWPGPTIRVNQGDKVRAIFTNNLDETTGVHFHGVEFDDFFQDGVPFITQQPILPGETYTYDFVANNAGSLMYHSHHNATDQVGRGLLGAFIVDPVDDPIQADREYLWISNDQLGGFTINGHGFPATVPVVAALGETVRIRFMNEGIMMHPWHLHGMPMRAVARDGMPLGSAAYDCDTIGVNPGERHDVLVTAKTLGVWAFHCHILPHAEGMAGMYGMVNSMIVVPKKEDVDAIIQAALA